MYFSSPPWQEKFSKPMDDYESYEDYYSDDDYSDEDDSLSNESEEEDNFLPGVEAYKRTCSSLLQ